jgi:outer membrane protein OmpA-like peptidoglycan-associated protein
MKSKPRVGVIAIGVLIGWTVFAAVAIYMMRPKPSPCADDRPGLWLRFDGDQPRLSGRAPAAAKFIAIIIGVDSWGYAQSIVCADGTTRGDEAWKKIITAVYRAPLAHLRTGEVMVRPDIVVIAGQTWNKAQRDELQSAVQKNLADAGLANVPLLIEIGVSPDPAFLRKVAALELRFPSRSAEISQDARMALIGLASDLRRADSSIIVTGHADATGRAVKNDAISQERADAVRELLVKTGIPGPRVRALGEGDRMPTADNGTAEGRAANRRVVIEIVATGNRWPIKTGPPVARLI